MLSRLSAFAASGVEQDFAFSASARQAHGRSQEPSGGRHQSTRSFALLRNTRRRSNMQARLLHWATCPQACQCHVASCVHGYTGLPSRYPILFHRTDVQKTFPKFPVFWDLFIAAPAPWHVHTAVCRLTMPIELRRPLQ